jgi:sugar phosphate isomerase/epimerase
MQDILRKVHAHMPYHLLPKYLEMIVPQKLNLEIYFSHYVLQNLDKKKCAEEGKILADTGLKVTFHAPFMDLRPAALDDKIRQTSLDRIKQAFEVASYFHPLKIVCHPSFDDRYYVSCDDLWLENSVKTWTQLIALARDTGTMIALENVYEKEPNILRRLFELLSSDHICFCFDTGHFNVFSYAPLSVWLAEMGKYLGHLHLHDNHGRTDEHLPVSCGTFPFIELFETLRTIKAKPTLTLEAHSQNDLWQSMNNIKDMALLNFLD